MGIALKKWTGTAKTLEMCNGHCYRQRRSYILWHRDKIEQESLNVKQFERAACISAACSADCLMYRPDCSSKQGFHRKMKRQTSKSLKGMPTCLELFSGTGSIGKAIKNGGRLFLLMCGKHNPTHCIDIGDFDYKSLYSRGEMILYGAVLRAQNIALQGQLLRTQEI